ncbi:MAG: EAL domain-containing response regulator [Pseudomonadota bacterium]
MKPGTHVLVADDDPLMRSILESYLVGEKSAQVTTVENGQHALAILSDPSKKIEFVLSDLNMPQMDGVQFLRALRDIGYTGRLAIISGEDSGVVNVARDLATFYRLDLVGTLAKPVNKQKLEQLMETVSAELPVAPSSSHFEFTPLKLHDAIANRHLIPYYQPKICIKTGLVTGAEALARWIDPQFGVISPAQFIEAAQAAGQMKMLTTTVLRQAIESCSLWQRSGHNLKVAINLTPDMFEWREFPDELAAMVDAVLLQRSSVILEITESNFLRQDPTVLEVLARLRLYRFDLAIDDFGTGFSNIEQLRKFPFSQLKIDQSFVRNATQDRFAKASVEACVHLGRELNMSIVAEGVENQTDWDFVAECGVDEVQGYFVAKPMAEADFLQWVGARNSTMSAHLSQHPEHVQTVHELRPGTLQSTRPSQLAYPAQTAAKTAG